jgi:hypothetical protein
MIAVIAATVVSFLVAFALGYSRGYGAGRQDEADYEARRAYRANRIRGGVE